MKTIYLASIGLLVSLSITQNVFTAATKEDIEARLLSARDGNFTHEQNKLGIQLIKAVIDSNADEVSNLIAQGAPANFREISGRHPLGMAVNSVSLHRTSKKENRTSKKENRATKIVDILLAAHADVNMTNGDGWTPLMWISKDDENHDIINMLLAAGARASINQQSHSGACKGTTALMAAFLYPDTVRLLLQAGAGASINYQNADKETVLVQAVEMDWRETVRLLIYAGADVDTATDMWGKSVWTMLLFDDMTGVRRTCMTEIMKQAIEERDYADTFFTELENYLPLQTGIKYVVFDYGEQEPILRARQRAREQYKVLLQKRALLADSIETLPKELPALYVYEKEEESEATDSVN